MIERRLTDRACLNEDWHAATVQASSGQRDIEEICQAHGELLAARVLLKQLSRKQLKQDVKHANQAQAEVFDVIAAEGMLLHAADQHEAVARHIAHHSGKVALSLVGNRRNQENYLRMRHDTLEAAYEIE